MTRTEKIMPIQNHITLSDPTSLILEGSRASTPSRSNLLHNQCYCSPGKRTVFCRIKPPPLSSVGVGSGDWKKATVLDRTVVSPSSPGVVVPESRGDGGKGMPLGNQMFLPCITPLSTPRVSSIELAAVREDVGVRGVSCMSDW
jgi:hypothetical protein